MKNISEISFKWFFNISEIELGESSVLGQNYLVFYIVHLVAMSLIVTSLFASAVVIVSILWRTWRNSRQRHIKEVKQRKIDFSDRFPVYLAVADGLWSISHFVDHLYLVTSCRYPSSSTVSAILSINLWMFLGYQQLMHAGLAIYTYMRVVRGVTINLGKWEWKLHCVCATLTFTSIALFYPLNAFGPSGYWMLQDVRTKGGIALGFYVTISGSIQALCTTLGYRQIQKVVQRQKTALLQNKKVDKGKGGDRYSTASECLTTFMAIGLSLYCPLAVVYCAFVVQNLFGVIEPITATLIVVSANSSGLANAIGYFHNVKVKSKRDARAKADKFTLITTSTACSSHSNSNTLPTQKK